MSTKFVQTIITVSDPDVIEPLFVGICVHRGKNIIVGSLYRPPCCNVAAFLEKKFTEFITKISRIDKNTVILKFNLDLLRYADHEATQKFVDCLFSHVFVLPEKLGRGVRPASQNPYPIYDLTKNLIHNL